MADIRIKDLPPETVPAASEKLAIDGSSTRSATITAIVEVGRPTASQAEAEAGVQATKSMTPLTTAQAIAARAASLAQGSLADSAVQPADLAQVATSGDYDDLSNQPTLSADLIYPVTADAVAATVPAAEHALKLNGDIAEGDGLGGLYIDTNTGSADTFTSNGGTRTWYRAEDVDRVRVVSAFGNSVPKSPLEYGATGDGTTIDLTNYTATEAAQAVVFLPSTSVFNLGTTPPVNPVSGPGSLKVSGVTLSGYQVKVDAYRSTIFLNPSDYTNEIGSVTAGYNKGVLIGSGAKLQNVMNRFVGIGSSVLQNAVVVDRSNFIGDGAGQFTLYGERLDIKGSAAGQWLGTSQALFNSTHPWVLEENIAPGAQGAAINVTGATQASTCVITAPGHGFAVGSNGKAVKFASIGGMTQLNGNVYKITGIDANTFSLQDGWGVNINSTAFGAYTSGGNIRQQWNFGDMEVRNPGLGATIAAFTGWATASTDVARSVAHGRDALGGNVISMNDTSTGYRAGAGFSTNSNSFHGSNSGSQSVFLTQFTAQGYNSARWWQTGTRNLVQGTAAADDVVDGSYNTIIGPYAASADFRVVNDNVIIGYAGANTIVGTSLSDIFLVGNRNRPFLITGDFVTGRVGIGAGLTPALLLGSSNGSLHIQNASFGAVEAVSTALDDFILESGGSTGMSIRSATGALGQIGFTRPTQATRAVLQYDHATDQYNHNIAGTTRLQVGNGLIAGTGGSFMGAGTLNVIADIYRGGTKVVGARDTGWTAMTGTADEATAYATGTVTLPQLAGRVMALQAALATHGLIGA